MRRSIAVAAGVTAALTLTLTACSSSPEPAPTSSSSAAVAAVPNVVGLSLAMAGMELEEQGFEVGIIIPKPFDAPEGTVLTQAVAAGTEAAPGTAVDLTVAVANTVVVPNVLNLNTSGAAERIVSAGLVVGSIKEVNSSEKAGEVVAQSPHAGNSVPKGSTIDLRVSNGTEGVIDVIGLSEDSAKAALTDAGFKVRVTKAAALDPAGTVTSQTPKAGKQAKVGSTVSITVSTGPAPEPTPTPTPSPIKPVKCDEASLTDAINKELKKQGEVVDASVDKPVTFKCADGADATRWAAAAAQIVRADGSSPAPVVQQFIFEAEGQFWVPVATDQACAMGSPLPSSLRKIGCEPVLGAAPA